ncbi:MAG: PspC domain-containing protein [Actinomycetaceae bacterium]|nr:PspC domain-containing protein [Actinomycetaceae bacterium]
MQQPPQIQRPPFVRTPRGFPGRPRPILAGVCSGLAVHLNLSVRLVRAVMVVITLSGGAGLLLYVWLWAMVPKASAEQVYRGDRLAKKLRQPFVEKQMSGPTQGYIVAAVFLALAFYALGVLNGWWGAPVDAIAMTAIVVGLFLVWSQASSIQDIRNPSVMGILAVGVLLIFGGAVPLIAGSQSPYSMAVGGLLTAVVIGILALAFLPAWLRVNRDLSTTKIAQAREAERADIAAHLHDSVLQTLMLIKTYANEPAKVKSLALTQERELRAWLYTGAQETADSFVALLKDTAEEIEKTYGEEVDVVTVGDCIPGPNELAACAAASEAMKNAVRHGEPTVQVYSEVGQDMVEIFIRDRGNGFDLADVPEDRHGVRDSIIARTERVEGRVGLRRLEPGTEVHISVPHSHMERQ